MNTVFMKRWMNTRVSQPFDVVVIGGGAAGMLAPHLFAPPAELGAAPPLQGGNLCGSRRLSGRYCVGIFAVDRRLSPDFCRRARCKKLCPAARVDLPPPAKAGMRQKGGRISRFPPVELWKPGRAQFAHWPGEGERAGDAAARDYKW